MFSNNKKLRTHAHDMHKHTGHSAVSVSRPDSVEGVLQGTMARRSPIVATGA